MSRTTIRRILLGTVLVGATLCLAGCRPNVYGGVSFSSGWHGSSPVHVNTGVSFGFPL